MDSFVVLNDFALQWVALLLFTIAVLHSLFAYYFERVARLNPKHAGVWHLLGEVEVVFGFWAMVLISLLLLARGRTATVGYLEGLSFIEPMFVFVIMVMAASRPILQLVGNLVHRFARWLPLESSKAFYWVTLAIVPLMGSFITEPAAMTLAALLLRERYYLRSISPAMKYATLGVLLVNISIGGILTPYAAPPVLMVAQKWGWGLEFMLMHFGIKAAIIVLINATLVTLLFGKELAKVTLVDGREHTTKIPTALTLAHLIFLILVVVFNHHLVLFMGVFLLFLGVVDAYEQYQDRLILREGLLVAFFLAGLVVLGGMQKWWLQPLLANLDVNKIYFGAVALTAVTDNAALTYLGSLLEGISEDFKYALVAGAVTGGGLTVIANAPNPAGFAMLKDTFPNGGISAIGLFLAAFPATGVAILVFRFL